MEVGTPLSMTIHGRMPRETASVILGGCFRCNSKIAVRLGVLSSGHGVIVAAFRIVHDVFPGMEFIRCSSPGMRTNQSTGLSECCTCFFWVVSFAKGPPSGCSFVAIRFDVSVIRFFHCFVISIELPSSYAPGSSRHPTHFRSVGELLATAPTLFKARA